MMSFALKLVTRTSSAQNSRIRNKPFFQFASSSQFSFLPSSIVTSVLLSSYSSKIQKSNSSPYCILPMRTNRPIALGYRSISQLGGDKKDSEKDSDVTKRNSILKPSRWVSVSSIAIGASVLFGKTKYFLVAMKLTKLAPLASMVLTSFAYSFVFGWPYAVGIVGLIFSHECGHAIMLRQYGIPFSPMVFVPFIGAVIVTQGNPQSAYEEALIALGGPVLGTIAAGTCGLVGIATGNQLLIALTDFGYMLNLFNLMPIGALDGGRVGSAISPWFGVAGLVGGGTLVYYSMVQNPIFYLILLSGVYTTATRLFGWDDAKSKEYFKVPKDKQLLLLAAYVTIIATLLYAINENNKYRLTPRRLRQLKDGAAGIYSPTFDMSSDPFSSQDGNLYDNYFSDDKTD